VQQETNGAHGHPPRSGFLVIRFRPIARPGKVVSHHDPVVVAPRVVRGRVSNPRRVIGRTLRAPGRRLERPRWRWERQWSPSDRTIRPPWVRSGCAPGWARAEPQWKFPTENAVHGGPVVAGGVVHAGGGDQNVYAVRISTGRQVWKFPASNEVVAAPVVVNSVVYAADASGIVYALRASDSRVLWRSQTGSSVQSPVAVAGNVVYAGDTSGTLYALRAPR
jgi:outer membrane protein assembly factor BamB